jgi:SecD/SecF fusion protein
MVERRSHLILMGLILAALVGVALLAVPGSPIQRKVTLGLDLQGGLEVVKKAVPEKGEQVDEEGMDDAVSIIRSRIDSVGAFEPEIRKQGSDQIVIELPGVRDQKRATELIGQTAKLELYDLQGDLIPGASLDTQQNPIARDSIFDLLSTQQTAARNGEPSAYYLIKETKKGKQTVRKTVVGPKPTRQAILDSAYVKKNRAENAELPKGTKLLAVPEKMVVVSCGQAERYCPGVNQEELDRTYYYLFRYDPQNEENPIPEMTGDDLERKGTRQDFDSGPGRGNEPVVTMQFTDGGADKFEEVTRRLVERGRSRASQLGLTDKVENDVANQQFAIVLDRVIKSAPTVDFDDNPSGIPGNNGAIITGVSINEAKDLAIVLRSGTLPFKLVTIEQTNISATLGKDSLQEAKLAAIGGLLVVALFLLIFYRFLGVVAVLGLGIYAALLYGVVLALNKQVTMTLPGFAGLILTIGVAADANVVVFERIKEEVRAGKSVRAAISAGYSKGFHTIIDANVVTAITALVLFLVATAGVKGFALMLLIGTAMSLVTAVFATRAMLGLLAGFSWFDSPRFMGAAGQQGAKWLQIDFIGRRRVWFAFSCVVVAISIGALAVRGLNLGIDFKGGTQVNFDTPQAQPVDQVRNEARSIDSSLGNAQIVGRGPSTNGEYKSFQIRTESLSPELGNKLRSGLESELQATAYGSKNVSESFGRQIARSAILAIIFSLVLIVLYLAIRFDLKYALPVIVALLHDVVITVGVYALTGREVSTATVAAVLTVLGYSIYDTIIILDRIRENVPLMRRSSFATIANVSLWETIRRSLATTFITLLPIASLLFFGGDTLKDFAFALLVGIGFGAYSSIFIAAPLLTTLKEREPEWARKIGREDIDEGPEPDDGKPVKRPPRAPIGGPAVDTGTIALEQATQAAAAEPAPALAEGLLPEPAPAPTGAAQSKREKRRQRRRAKPHGRPR